MEKDIQTIRRELVGCTLELKLLDTLVNCITPEEIEWNIHERELSDVFPGDQVCDLPPGTYSKKLTGAFTYYVKARLEDDTAIRADFVTVKDWMVGRNGKIDYSSLTVQITDVYDI